MIPNNYLPASGVGHEAKRASGNASKLKAVKGQMERMMDVFCFLDEEANRRLFVFSELTSVYDEMLGELFEYKERYGVNDRYEMSEARLEKLKSVINDYSRFYMQYDRMSLERSRLINENAGLKERIEMLEQQNDRLRRFSNE